jgi:hypothetical protein
MKIPFLNNVSIAGGLSANRLTLFGNLSSSGNIIVSGGNSDQWNSNYSITNTNSAAWSNWPSVSGNYALGTQYVKLSGDTMTGLLTINSTTNPALIVGDGNTGYIKIGDGTFSKIAGSGWVLDNLRVNGSNWQNGITFRDGGANAGLWSAGTGILSFSNNITESMRLDASGNLGIGTTAPAARLTVASLSSQASTIALSSNWNNAGTTYTALSVNVNDMASNSNSLLADLQVGGSSYFNVSKVGAITFGGPINARTITANTGGVTRASILSSGQIEVTNTLSVSADLSASGNFASGNMLLGSKQGGGYFGKTSISENPWFLNETVFGSNSAVRSVNTSLNVDGISISSDGKRILVATGSTAQLKYSQDFGNTFTDTGPVSSHYKTCMSNDGRIQVSTLGSAAGNSFISTDYGSSWRTLLPEVTSHNDCAMSSDGRIIAIGVGSNDIYISENYGVSFENRKSPGTPVVNIAMSSDGRIIAHTEIGNAIWVSYNFGKNWVTKFATGPSGSIPIKMSSDGRFIVAGVFSGLLLSNNFGRSVSFVNLSKSISDVYISGDGKIIICCINGENYRISTDYGATFREGTTQLLTIAGTSDARIIVGRNQNSTLTVLYNTSIIYNPTTIAGSLSVAGVIYSAAGNSNQWNSTYSTVFSNSASWKESADILPTLSAKWNSTFGTVSSLSANWNNAGAYTLTATNFKITRTSSWAVDTSTSSLIASLPFSPSTGTCIRFLDAKKTWATNNLLILRSGEVIESVADDLNCDISGFSFEMTYVGGSVGWRVA